MVTQANRTFEWAANVTTVIVLVVAGLLGFRWDSRQPDPPLPSHHYWSVRQLPLRFDLADRTLVLALSPRCAFCASSMPFYRGVVQARGRSSVRAAIVVISTAPRAETAKFLALHQLRLFLHGSSR
jgi:hypothetical protein